MYPDGSVRLLHDISTDTAVLATAIKAMTGTVPNSATETNPAATYSQQVIAASVANNGPDKPVATLDNPAFKRQVDEEQALLEFKESTSGSRALELRRNMEATLSSMRQIGEAFWSAPGRKAFIWITGSFPLDLNGTGDLVSPQAVFQGSTQEAGAYHMSHSGALPPMPESGNLVSDADLTPLRQQFRTMLQRFAAGNIVLYPLDARGVMTQNSDASDPNSNQILLRLQKERVQTSQSTIKTMAKMTGGKACYNKNDITSCLHDASYDSEEYYLLSYYRDKNNNKPGWRKLSVTVDQPDAEVRAHTGYYYGKDLSEKDARLQELSAAARSTVPFTAIQFSARFTGASGNGDKKQVKYEIYLPPESMRALNDADSKFNLEFVVIASPLKGSSNYTVATTVGKNLPPEAYRTIQDQGLAYHNVLSLSPGDYTVHFIVRDVARNVVGSVIASLRTNDPALQAQSAPSNNGIPIAARYSAKIPKLSANAEASTVWMPSDVDAQKPSVAAGVGCPANILEATANPSKELVDSVAQFSAVEHVVHENFSPQGTPQARETREFDYVASITQNARNLTVQEYREPNALDNLGGIKSSGLAALAIAFHPFFHDNFEMHCEGLGAWNGQAAWLVYFREVENKPNQLRSYVVKGNYYPVSLKGRAWIDADNLQIIHLETDLLHPIPEIQLMSEHTDVSYGPVQFKASGADLWLPKSAELYVRFGKRSFHRSESFDNFKLFATDVTYKVKLPKSD